MGALSDPRVGEYFAENYVAYYERIGSFTILPSGNEQNEQNDANLKQGGNVGSFFCNTAGQVVHAVAGPVQANTLLSQARWARDTYTEVRTGRLVRSKLSEAHSAELFRLSLDPHRGVGEIYSIHTYLGQSPLVPVKEFSREVFTYLLNEPVDEGETPLHLIDRLLEQARQARSAFVLIVHQDGEPIGLEVGTTYRYGSMPVAALALSDTEMRDLEQRQGWEAHSSPESGHVRCVVFNILDREIDSFLVPADPTSIRRALAQGRDRAEETPQETERRQATDAK